MDRTVTPALARLLAELPAQTPVERLDRVWIFPPRRQGEVETGLVVLSLMAEREGEMQEEQREVVTVRYEQRAGGKGAAESRERTSRGWAPAERVPRMIAGVLRRLGERDEEPEVVEVGGDANVWARYVAGVSAGLLDPANGE